MYDEFETGEPKHSYALWGVGFWVLYAAYGLGLLFVDWALFKEGMLSLTRIGFVVVVMVAAFWCAYLAVALARPGSRLPLAFMGIGASMPLFYALALCPLGTAF